jgi:anti-anti-sigma regulatory factor
MSQIKAKAVRLPAVTAAPTLVLAAMLDLRETAALKTELAAQSAAKAISIDGHAVKRVSTAAIQILIAFVVTMRKSGSAVRFVSLSPALLAGFESLGVASILRSAGAEG